MNRARVYVLLGNTFLPITIKLSGNNLTCRTAPAHATHRQSRCASPATPRRAAQTAGRALDHFDGRLLPVADWPACVELVGIAPGRTGPDGDQHREHGACPGVPRRALADGRRLGPGGDGRTGRAVSDHAARPRAPACADGAHHPHQRRGAGGVHLRRRGQAPRAGATG